MKYEVLTIKNQTVDLGMPCSVKLNRSKDAPCDDINITFPIDKLIDEVKVIYVYNQDKLIFKGIVDQQSIEYTSSGIFLNIVARSPASYLLDNEAKPQTYYRPSLKIIFEKHIKPFGFKGFIGNGKVFSSTFVISKGMSEWDVLEKFCNNYLRIQPRVTLDEYIDASGKSTNKEIIFSNAGGNLKYSSFSYKIRRHKRLSEIFVRATKNDSYSIKVSDYDAINKSIKRRRYLNATDESLTPVIAGQNMISNSKKDAYEFILQCPGVVDINLGDKIKINDYVLGEFRDIFVKEIIYTLNSNFEMTQIKATF